METQDHPIEQDKKKPLKKSRSVPQVRHTLTSYRRLVQANPWMRLKENGFEWDTRKEYMAKLGKKQEKVPLQKSSVKRPTSQSMKPSIKDCQFKPTTSKNSEPHLRNIQNTKMQGAVPKIVISRKVNRTLSEGNLENISPIQVKKIKHYNMPCPKTPSDAEKHLDHTFITPQLTRRTGCVNSSTPAPFEFLKLQERLNKWLKTRGKPPAMFYHLKIFLENHARESNIDEPLNMENKENIGTRIGEDNVQVYAKEALVELLHLIEEDYSRNQCLRWLELLKTKYFEIDKEPEYWECRAAIEQSEGNIYNAVECYKAAIIKGAEVTSVDKLLDNLLKKFSLLNISSSESNKNPKIDKVVIEARNVFKSSIIQFAIKEKNSRRKDAGQSNKNYLVTPVRRSTRLSRSGYVNTPGLQLCRSLKDINLSSEDIHFQPNKALF
ncbi:hypothetical protein ABEB36_004499 [Hypothenemus hampei]|uniref:Cytoskeleton-associated protein 2-like n=1 Tax=Hypothenemus hampei TaxID=57062 RepID=A0ABD1F3J9_HYPHA